MAADKKGAIERQAILIFEDEANVCLCPPVRRTWSPRGVTPILRALASREKINMVGGLAWDTHTDQCQLLFQFQYPAVNGEAIAHYLGLVKQHFHQPTGRPVVVIWDNLSAHESVLVKECIQQEADWLTVHPLPSYAPELNPQEYVWSAIKGKDTANSCPNDLQELKALMEAADIRIANDQEILKGCLRASGLFKEGSDVPA